MKNKKTLILTIIIILETIILGISLLYSSLIFFVKDIKLEWFDEISPDGKYHVKCYTIGSALFFSPQKLEIYFDTTGMPYIKGTNPLSFKTELANDGANLRAENYSIEWLDTYVKIIFRGEETGGDNVFIIPYYKSGNIENINDSSSETVDNKTNIDENIIYDDTNYGKVFDISNNKLIIGFDEKDTRSIEIPNNCKIIDYETESTISINKIEKNDFVKLFIPTNNTNMDAFIFVAKEKYITDIAEKNLIDKNIIDTSLTYYNEKENYALAEIPVGEKIINNFLINPVYYLKLAIGGITETYLGNKENPVETNYPIVLNELCRVELLSKVAYLPNIYIVKTIEFIAD